MPIPTSPYAGFGERTAAYLIDSLLLGIGNLILGALFANSPGALLAAVILLPAIYFIAGWTSSNGQTIGMRALNLKLQRTNGDHVGFAHALGRYLWLGLSMLCLGFGVFSVGWDERKQGWHDKFADTFVLRAQ